MVLGSGWLAAADAIGAPEAEISTADLGGFAQPTVKGHTPSVRYIRKGKLRVLLYLGRIHLYEGHHPHAVVHGVRTAIAAGCRTVVLTNAAGGINDDYAVGQPVLISDHINLTGRSPLAGPLPVDVPSRFTDLTETYSVRLRDLARQLDPTLPEGVYAAVPGPHFETRPRSGCSGWQARTWSACPPPSRRSPPADLGAEVLGVSIASNPAAGLSAEPINHQDVLAATEGSAARVGELLSALLPACSRNPGAPALPPPAATSKLRE